MDFTSYIQQYGILIFAIMFVVGFGTEVIKLPIKALAQKFVDKGKLPNIQIITRWFVTLPFVLSYGIWFVVIVIEAHGDMVSIDWVAYSTTASLIATTSVTVYEAVCTFVKSQESK